MRRAGRIARRAFLGLGIGAAASFSVGFWAFRREHANPLDGLLAEEEAAFSPWIVIGRDNAITVITPRAEMGQHIHTTLAALAAEELDAELDQIRAEHGPPGPAYFNAAMLRDGAPFPWFEEGALATAARAGLGEMGRMLGLQVTGGSTSTIDGYERMRRAGAGARETLKRAASEVWSVPVAELATVRAHVIHQPTGRRLAYGALIDTARRLGPPPEPALRDPSEWRLLGRSQRDLLGPAKVTGAPIYGIDLDLPGMVHATVAMAPRFGARPLKADLDACRASPGVIDVVPLSVGTQHGFGVIAAHTWAAFRGAEALAVEWGAAAHPADDAAIGARYEAALQGPPSFAMGGRGDARTALDVAAPERVLTARYSVPFLAHAAMEPLNATAQFEDGLLRLWCGTQAPGMVRLAAARALGIEREAVEVTVLPMGGGFGRRAEVDFALMAALLARETAGRPIKVTWSRAEDTRHDAYRPAARAELRAVIRRRSRPEAIVARAACPATAHAAMGRIMPSLPAGGPDATILDGLHDQPYAFPASRFEAAAVDLEGIPTGFWRAVGHSQNAFFLETFLDEVAAASGIDPLALRLKLMAYDERFAPGRRVLEDVARRSGWGERLPEGRGRGIAFALSFGTWVAQVVEVDAAGGSLRMTRAWISADPGKVLDQSAFEAQLVGGMVWGLGQAIDQAITFRDGMVEQEGFHDFPPLAAHRCPQIDVALLESAPRMGGAGEVGTPPAAPALGNAIYAATGRRLRDLPFSRAVPFA